ncbi:MAG: UDP-2,3-diacylglucosamine diphosphatase [Bacteroidota bacterium]
MPDKPNNSCPHFDTLTLPPLPKGKKVFFASDFHLGTPQAHDRERKIVDWLESILPIAHALFLLGDIFDLWFEYKHVVPKGFTRFQGKLAHFADQGIPVYLLLGNRDLGMYDYLHRACNVRLFRHHVSAIIHQRTFLIGHGDLLAGSRSYKRTRKIIYENPTFRWLFRQLHPDLGLPLLKWLTNAWHNQQHTCMPHPDPIFQACQDLLEPVKHHDFYIFGHLHKPCHAMVHANSAYYNIGDWVQHATYGAFDGEVFSLERDLSGY